MPGTDKQAQRKLFETAIGQSGYFTTRQALEAGFSDATHPYHLKNGDWVREWRGIYRVEQFPQTGERPELMLWYLWSRNREDMPQGVFSQDTALDIYELSDAMPAKLHMTVPRKFRKSQKIPGLLVLHYEDLSRSDYQLKYGVQVTTPQRTFIDLLKTGKLSNDIMIQALIHALERGLLTRKHFSSLKADPEVGTKFKHLVATAKKHAKRNTPILFS
jgi:predicted transcriptional regulator of viral defense system